MSHKPNRILIVSFLLIASAFCLAVYAQKGQVAKIVWDYNVVSSITGDDPTRLTQLGNDGWELTSIRTEEQMVGNYRQTRIYYYLKRPRQTGK